MANNQITPFQLTDQFTMDNFNQRINETNTALQNKADIDENGKVPESQLPSMGYSKPETLSDTTKTLFGLDATAVPDDVFSCIHTSLGKKLSVKIAWENVAPTSEFAQQNLTIPDLSNAKDGDWIAIETWKDGVYFIRASSNVQQNVRSMGCAYINAANGQVVEGITRNATINGSTISFSDCKNWATINYNVLANSMYVPYRIYIFRLED